jgi:hypothetical protein
MLLRIKENWEWESVDMMIRLTENNSMFNKSHLIDKMYIQGSMYDTDSCPFFQDKNYRFLKKDNWICPYSTIPKDIYKEFQKEIERMLDECK